jgi:hypothetical protein
LRTKTIEFNKRGYLKHLKGYRWKEANWEDVKNIKYDKMIPTAHAILIGSVRTERPSSA